MNNTKSLLDEQPAKNFCAECGFSLKPFDLLCQSKECDKCERPVYFQRKAAGGGYHFEAGEQAHISEITLSLDPMEGGRKNFLSRAGLEMLITKGMSDGGYKPKGNFLEYCKQREKELDDELSSVEYLNHLDLNNQEHVLQAFDILKREGAKDYRAKLITSTFFHHVPEQIKEGNPEASAEFAFMAAIFVNYQLLENIHFKEIIWLGYQAYSNLKHNEGLSPEEAQEKLLVDQVAAKLESLSYAHVLSLSLADEPLSVHLNATGVREKGLRALIEHEIERRKKVDEKNLRNREVIVKERESKLKLWSFIFTVVNVAVGFIIKYI
jgi:hypothetical protein